MSADGQRIKWRRNIAENFNRLSRAHERYRQTDRQTDDRHIANVNVHPAAKILARPMTWIKDLEQEMWTAGFR